MLGLGSEQRRLAEVACRGINGAHPDDAEVKLYADGSFSVAVNCRKRRRRSEMTGTTRQSTKGSNPLGYYESDLFGLADAGLALEPNDDFDWSEEFRL